MNLDEEGVVLLCLGELLLGLGLVLLAQGHTQVLARARHLVVQVHVARTLLRRLLNHLHSQPTSAPVQYHAILSMHSALKS